CSCAPARMARSPMRSPRWRLLRPGCASRSTRSRSDAAPSARCSAEREQCPAAGEPRPEGERNDEVAGAKVAAKLLEDDEHRRRGAVAVLGEDAAARRELLLRQAETPADDVDEARSARVDRPRAHLLARAAARREQLLDERADLGD